MQAQLVRRKRKKMRTDRRLIVFDLDGTLVYRSNREGEEEIKLRPHVVPLLESLSRVRGLDIGIWTASTTVQAQEIVRTLKESVPGLSLAFVKDQRNCQIKYDASNGEYHAIKDLRKTKKMGWSLHSTIIVEDTPQNCVRNRGNSIYVRSWRGWEEDLEMDLLRNFLFAKCADPLVSVRSLPLQDRWRETSF